MDGRTVEKEGALIVGAFAPGSLARSLFINRQKNGAAKERRMETTYMIEGGEKRMFSARVAKFLRQKSSGLWRNSTFIGDYTSSKVLLS